MYEPEIETRPIDEQFQADKVLYQQQIEYLFNNSPFYQAKLKAAGFNDAKSVGSLENIHQLPFTDKDELRKSQAQHSPFGDYLAADPENLIRVFSTSGTTGTPCYIGLTKNDLDMFATNVARGYTACGFSPKQRIVISANAGPFVAGASYNGFDKIGCTVIPVGTGNTERLMAGIQKLGATGISCTPSYGFYLMDWCADRNIDTKTLGIKNMINAGEPGSADPMIRARLKEAFQCDVREAMGIGDISLTVWAEDEGGEGMHLMARDFVHVELIEPDTGEPLPWEEGVQGELVYTALQREAMPLLRFRSRDHVTVTMAQNSTGRTGPRIRCIGRTDDMLIVRGVNLFPSAVRNVLQEFSPAIGEIFMIKPEQMGVAQTPPLPLEIELGQGNDIPSPELADSIQKAIRQRLLVNTKIELLPYGSLPRGEYKTSMVDYSNAKS